MPADVTLLKTPAETRLGEHFAAFRAALPPSADAESRDSAFQRFAAKGLPHRRIEAWHYTDLRSLLREAHAPAGRPDEAARAAARGWLEANPDAAVRRVVLIDGHFEADLSALDDLSPGVAIRPAGAASPTLRAVEALGRDETVLALNAAFAGEGVTLALADGAAPTEPVEVLHFVSAAERASVSARTLVELGNHASLVLVERHVSLGAADSQVNAALLVSLGDGASLDHVATVQDFPAGAVHIGSSLARLGADARFATFTLSATAGLVRRQIFTEFAGEQSSVSLNGVSLLDGKAHADTTLVVTHTAPHCESREYFKAILGGESTGVYQGKVVVAPGAQKTDGKMMSRAIFLDDGATMFNKPELEIFADDVVCGHGATVGFLDETQLFYLRSRGIPRKQAQAMLLNAFAADAIELVGNEALRDQLTETVERWLAKRQG